MQRFGCIAGILVAFCVLGCTVQFTNAQEEEPMPHVNCSQPPLFRHLKTCCWGGGKTKIDDATDQCFKEIKRMDMEDEFDEEICKYDCIFNKTKILTKEGTIDHEAVTKFFSRELEHDQVLVELMSQTFEDCNPKVNWVVDKLPNDFEEGECRPFANLMRLCVASHGILDCPKERWVNSEECNNIRDAHSECPFDKMH